MRIADLDILETKQALNHLPDNKLMINTINAYSYTVARRDPAFAQALNDSDVLLPDGAGIVYACRLLKAKSRPKERITGWDLFTFEMERLNARGGQCFFMGCSDRTLAIIREKAAKLYPNITVETYSPPYKDAFDEKDSAAMIEAINAAQPDLLWIGMSAPKQEKWLAGNWDKLEINCHAGSIGAVFSFFAGTEKRAPEFWCRHGLEWLYRFVHNPGRLWPRYVTGNLRFAGFILSEKFRNKSIDRQ